MILSNYSRLFINLYLVFLQMRISRSNATCLNGGMTVKCCSGYRNITGICTECIGFYGEDCLYPCGVGVYGAQCKEQCNCSQNETCNQYIGCTFSNEKKGVNDEVLDCRLVWQIMFSVIGIQLLLFVICIGKYLRKGIILTARRNVSEISKGSKSRVENLTERDMIVEEGRQLRYIEDDVLQSTDQNREIDEAYNHIHFQRVPIIQHSSDEYGSVKRPNRCHKSTH
ncbi:uncharacterized protein LOC111100267 isoform X1 [Crassostrea virginica]